MGGIAGIVYPDTFQASQRIHPMMRALLHRGCEIPDIVTYKNIEMGFCNDSFFANPKKAIYAGIDGRIENEAELSHDLKLHGLTCEGKNQAELILLSYELWGNAFIHRVNGKFAISILDTSKKKLLLIRDRIGEKPLYWYHDQNHFIFASELKSILASGLVSQTPAQDAFSAYLQFGYIPQDMTPIRKVNKLLPSYYLEFHFDQSKIIEPYWSYSSHFEKHTPIKKQAVVAKLNDLLSASVQNLLPKNEPIGCLISGGLGSAAVAYYTAKLTNNVSSYSAGFQGQNEEDISVAKEVSTILGIPHESRMIPSQNLLTNFANILWYLDEPIADPNVIATWNLAELASHHTEHVFSGMGSDELLAGHSRYTITPAKQPLLPYLKVLLLPLLKLLYKPAAYAYLKRSRTNPWQIEYMRHNALFDEATITQAAPALAKLFDPEIFLHKFHHLSRIKSTVASYLYLDVKTRLPDHYILQFERLTAAHGLQWSAPFLDRRVIEFLASLMEQESISEKETARFLKEILNEVFPDYIVNRPKRTRHGFLKSWADESEIKTAFMLLPFGALAEAGLVSEKWLKEKTATPEMRAQHFPLLWAILTLEVWYRLFITKPVTTSPPNINVLDLLNEK